MLRTSFAALLATASIFMLSACGGGGAVVPQQKAATQAVTQGGASASIAKAADTASAQTYRLVLLPSNFVPAKINDVGVIVGQDSNNRAVEYRDGRVTELPLLPTDQTSVAFDINDRDQIVGLSLDNNTTGPPNCNGYPCPIMHAVLWENGRVRNLGELTNQTGFGLFYNAAERINNAGEIVGQSGYGYGALNEAPVAIFSPGAVRPVLVGGSKVYGAIDGLNERGEFVGNVAPNASDFSTTPFEYPTPIVCSPPIPSDAFIEGINNSDDVPWAYNGATPQDDFCIHSISHALTDFQISYAGLNNHGDVIGSAFAPEKLVYSRGHFLKIGSGTGNIQSQQLGRYVITGNGAVQGQVVSVGGGDALLYTNGKYYDLNALVPNHPGIQLSDPVSINDVGEIVGGEGNAPYGYYLLVPRFCMPQ